MIKRIKFTNLMPPILSVVATVVLIIACGKGEPEDIEKDDVMGLYVDEAYKNFLDGKLSSIAQNLSHKQGESSSSKIVDSTYVVTCKIVIDTGSVDIAIPTTNRPKVECASRAKPDSVIKVLDPRDDVQWFDAPVWGFPEAGNYSNIRIEVYNDVEVCKGLTATCSGTFKVCPPTGCPSSSSTAAASSSAVADNSSSSTAAASSSAVADNSSSSTPSSNSRVTILCELPATLTAGATISVELQRSYLKCSNTNASPDGNPRWAGTDPLIIENNQVPMAMGEYTDIAVFASCGEDIFTSVVRGNCNKVTIIAPVASSSSVAAGTASSSSVAAGTTSSSSVAAGTTSSSSVVTVTCSFAKTTYAVGESVVMNLVCSNTIKYERGAATFRVEGISPANANGWQNGGGTTYNSAGTSTVRVSNVTCDGKTIAAGGVAVPEATCPTLTITGGTTTVSSSSRAASSSSRASSSSVASSSSRASSSSAAVSSSSATASGKCNCVKYCSEKSCSALTTSGTFSVSGNNITGDKCVFFSTATTLVDNGTDDNDYSACTNKNASFKINGVFRSRCKREGNAGNDIYCEPEAKVEAHKDCATTINVELTATTVTGSTAGKVDGGYYLYIPVGGLNWGNITVTSTTPSTTPSPACTP